MTKTLPITDNFVQFKDFYRTYYKKKIDEFSTTIEEIMDLVEYKKDPLFADDEDDLDDYEFIPIEGYIAVNEKGNLLQEMIVSDKNHESETGIKVRMGFDVSKLLPLITDKDSRYNVSSLFDEAFWEQSNSIMELFGVDELYVSSKSSYTPTSPQKLDVFYHFHFNEELNQPYNSFIIDFPLLPEEKKLTINQLLNQKGLLLSPILSKIIDVVIDQNDLKA
jgi:hypothetical protein